MISIIFANRNRDVGRIKASLDSLVAQTDKEFEIIFVDYGSEHNLIRKYQDLFKSYQFVSFFSLDVAHLLWNKSKALNYGIKMAVSDSIFIADVDLIFHPEAVSLFRKLSVSDKFFLFPLSYLGRQESQKLYVPYHFSDLKPQRKGEVNGMVLAPRPALLQINGLDEFFHFYGAEDEDLFARLENAGIKREFANHPFFCHNWHQSFSGSKDKLLTGNPRIKNIMRINQRHFFENRRRKLIKPLRQSGMADKIESKKANLLQEPEISIQVPNILAHVEHFLGEELSSHKGKIVKVEFFEDPYYRSLKYWLKKKLGRQRQPYISMKQVNDMILKEILFRYRDYNYSFMISDDQQAITFSIQL